MNLVSVISHIAVIFEFHFTVAAFKNEIRFMFRIDVAFQTVDISVSILAINAFVRQTTFLVYYSDVSVQSGFIRETSITRLTNKISVK